MLATNGKVVEDQSSLESLGKICPIDLYNLTLADLGLFANS